jgi:pectate lyase
MNITPLANLAWRRAGTLTTALTLLLGSMACANKPLSTAPGNAAPAASTPAARATAPGKPDFSLVGFATLNGGTTGGAAGRTVTATTLAELITYAKATEPLVILIDRTLSGGSQGEVIKVKSDKTLLGVGSTGFLEGVGINISSARNVIVRNLKLTMAPVTNTHINDEKRPQVSANDGDCLTIQGASANIWVDHCEFYNVDPATQPNQDLYDGLLDLKDQSAYVTISWCYFHDHHKCHLIGSSDKDNSDRKVTFHHNRYDNIKERVPSYRFGTGHVFSNYYHHVGGSGVNSRQGACLRVEQNYFEDVRDPVVTKNSAAPGSWDVAGNVYVGCKGSQPTASTCTMQPAYSYTAALTPAAEVKAVVLQGAGVGKL